MKPLTRPSPVLLWTLSLLLATLATFGPASAQQDPSPNQATTEKTAGATPEGTARATTEETESLLPPDGIIVALPGGAEEVLGLQSCINEALLANDLLLAQKEVLGELESKIMQARATGMPKIDLKGNWLRGRDPRFAFDSTFGGGGDSGGGFGGIDTGNASFDSLYTIATAQLFGGGGFIPEPQDIPAQTFWTASADLHWELRPTQIYYAVKTANVALDQQDLAITDGEYRVVEDTMNAYYTVIASYAQVQSVRSEIDARQEFLDVTRRRFLLDMATPLDTLQARVQMANLLPELRRTRKDLQASGRTLNTVMGRNPSSPIAVQAAFQLELDPLSESKVVELSLRRPDVLQAEMQSNFLQRQRDTIGAQRHPYLVMEGAYGYVTREVEEWVDRGHNFWLAGVTLTIPLFDGLVTKGQLKEQDASIRRASHEISNVRRQAEREALLALQELEVARENLSSAELNFSQAEQALSQTRLRYELGKSNYLELLNAQAARFVARTNLIRANYDVLVWTTTLKRSAGLNPSVPLSQIAEVSQ